MQAGGQRPAERESAAGLSAGVNQTRREGGSVCQEVSLCVLREGRLNHLLMGEGVKGSEWRKVRGGRAVGQKLSCLGFEARSLPSPEGTGARTATCQAQSWAGVTCGGLGLPGLGRVQHPGQLVPRRLALLAVWWLSVCDWPHFHWPLRGRLACGFGAGMSY